MQIWLDRNRAESSCKQKPYPVQFSWRRKSSPVQCEHSVKCDVMWMIGEKRALAFSSACSLPPTFSNNYYAQASVNEAFVCEQGFEEDGWGNNGRRGSSPATTCSPHFSSGIVEQAKRERAWKSSHRVSLFLAWGDFRARSSFARSTIPEGKWGLLVV